MLTVLWDNDGVLVDTEGLYFQACREVLAGTGIDLTLEEFQDISLRRGESVFLLAADHGIAADDIMRLRQQRDRVYTELLLSQCPVNDGVETTLQALYGRVGMGIVTSSRRGHFEAAHAQTAVLRYMDFVLTREDYTHSKPNPEPYLAAMARHGLQPGQCLAVEDSERGLAAATAAGVACVIVLSDWTRDGDFGSAVSVVENIVDVTQIVLRRLEQTRRG